jgi:hypothetical protein
VHGTVLLETVVAGGGLILRRSEIGGSHRTCNPLALRWLGQGPYAGVTPANRPTRILRPAEIVAILSETPSEGGAGATAGLALNDLDGIFRSTPLNIPQIFILPLARQLPSCGIQLVEPGAA